MQRRALPQALRRCADAIAIYVQAPLWVQCRSVVMCAPLLHPSRVRKRAPSRARAWRGGVCQPRGYTSSALACAARG